MSSSKSNFKLVKFKNMILGLETNKTTFANKKKRKIKSNQIKIDRKK